VIWNEIGTKVSKKGRHSKGYVLCINKDIVDKCEVCKNNDLYCTVKVKNGSSSVNLLFCYHPPSSLVTTKSILDAIYEQNSKIIIIGDLNARIGSFGCDRKSKDTTINT